MGIRETISKVDIPYRNVAYAVGGGGMILMMVTSFLPPSMFFLKYAGIIISLAAILYIFFFVYKAGHRLEAIIMSILSIAVSAIVIVCLAYYFNLLYGA